MAKREVVWTRNSEIQLQEILEFYHIKNKSNLFSIKLYRKFKSELKIASQKPEIGVKTKIENIRGLIVDNYILYYEILKDKIMVLKIWGCRQNPDKLNIQR
jgi:plasmid stabilization system protein ParE